MTLSLLDHELHEGTDHNFSFILRCILISSTVYGGKKALKPWQNEPTC